MTTGRYTRWRCPICNHFLQIKSVKNSNGRMLDASNEGLELDRFAHTHDILYCSVCHYACKLPDPTRDIDEIVIPEYLEKYPTEGENVPDSHLRCAKCIIRYKFGMIRTDKWIGAALFDDPDMEWYRCDLEEGHPGNHIASVETPKGIVKLEWGDHDTSSSDF